jgi:hypothetical protein
MDTAAIYLQATLEQAMNELDKYNLNALYVERINISGIMSVYGILTREHIEKMYRLPTLAIKKTE